MLNTAPPPDHHIRVPVGSFYVEAAYLLTGETRSQLGIVKPRRPFSLRPGEFGPGAWEVFARYNCLDIGNTFSNGLARTDGNANRVWATDMGVTWHRHSISKCFSTGTTMNLLRRSSTSTQPVRKGLFSPSIPFGGAFSSSSEHSRSLLT